MPEREALDVDVLIVGGGPAGLSAAYHVRRLLNAAGRSAASVALIEKGKEIGAHIISGAVMDPRGMDELIPEWRERCAAFVRPVEEDRVLYLTEKAKFVLPVTPPPLRNHGNIILSLNRFVRWLGKEVEACGVDVFAGFAGTEVLMDGRRVLGVRTGDKGVDRRGRPKGNFEPGMDIRARLTIFAEGARGSLTMQLIRTLELDRGRNPQVYAAGVKEVWEVPKQKEARGWVVHTLGWPLRSEEFGGGFIYNMPDGMVSIGLVIGLDYLDPKVDPHARFQLFKTHPFVRDLLDGGALHSYGAKAIPEGGYWAQPEYCVDGAMIVGDSAGFLNSMRLKGIHLAVKSGMLAAESAFEALQDGDCSAAKLGRFRDLVEAGWIKEELWKVRNFHQGFEGGLWKGMLHTGLQMITGGRGLRNRYPNVAGHTRMRKLKDYAAAPIEPAVIDGKGTFDKLSDVYNSGTEHDEDQPCHLVIIEPDICRTRCPVEYGNPCQHFCPAAVYEMVDGEDGRARLQINASNCVHCKTCDIMDPYEVIRWVPPEGGGGPSYDLL
jgi:electron-transferring-flavoprotein dehydrogenase